MINYKHRKKQEGVALAIGIILLLVIAVIGVTSMKSALLQEKMAGGLARKGFADTAAYTMLVAVENYLFRLYQTNNGIQDPMCDYCGESDEIRGDVWHRFISQRNMLDGGIYPGSSSLITGLEGQLHDDPRFILYPIAKDSETGFSTGTVGEEGGGAAGGSSGALGDSSESSIMDFYKIAAKANDSTGNIFVIYESVFAIKQN